MSFSTEYFRFKKVNTEADLETLRIMRNSNELERFMSDKRKISREEQLNWYDSLDKKTNYYYLVYDCRKNGLIGYALIKNINWTNDSGEPGTFLIKPELLGTSEAALFMISFLDYCYFKLGIKSFFGNVLADNSRALANYEIFNPRRIKKTGNELNLESSEDYLQSTKHIRKALEALFDYKYVE